MPASKPQAKAPWVCCNAGLQLTCSNGHSEGIAAGDHGDLHGLEPHNQVGHTTAAAGASAKLPMLVAAEGVTLPGSCQQKWRSQGLAACLPAHRGALTAAPASPSPPAGTEVQEPQGSLGPSPSSWGILSGSQTRYWKEPVSCLPSCVRAPQATPPLPLPVTAAEWAVPMSAHTIGSRSKGAERVQASAGASSTWFSCEGSSSAVMQSRPSLLNLRDKSVIWDWLTPQCQHCWGHGRDGAGAAAVLPGRLN